MGGVGGNDGDRVEAVVAQEFVHVGIAGAAFVALRDLGQSLLVGVADRGQFHEGMVRVDREVCVSPAACADDAESPGLHAVASDRWM